MVVINVDYPGEKVNIYWKSAVINWDGSQFIRLKFWVKIDIEKLEK